jgi:endonuclease-3
MTKKERFKRFIEHFQEHMPEADTELVHTNPFELLVSTILSAQCTDKRVNMTTPALFGRFPDPEAMSKGTRDEIFELIKSISYPNNKTNHLMGMSKMLYEDFGSEVPEDVDDLQKLPGVGRKTAHVVASTLFNQPKLAVDTHVFRVAARLGLTVGAKTPLQTELQLVKHIPEDLIRLAHHWLILHGRYVCLARRPKCEACALTDVCKYYPQVLRKQNSKNIT